MLPFCLNISIVKDVGEMCIRDSLQTVLKEIDCKPDMETLTFKEKSAFVAGLLQDAAVMKNIDLNLRKKKG